MVHIKYINKSIDSAIIKCSQHLTLNSKVTNTFNKFHEETCGKKVRKTEKGVVTDNDGNILWEIKGNKKELTGYSTKKMQDLYEEYGDVHITHNHPRVNGTRNVAETLSRGDIDCLFDTYRPYGKRADGSEGYLVGEEGVFYMKSISCESANGSRMTLVRGDDFKHEDKTKALALSRRLGKYWDEYDEAYYEKCSELSSKTLNRISKMGGIPNDEFKTSDEVHEYVRKEALKTVGIFEKNDTFKKIQKEYRDINCKLIYTFPYEYQIS